MLGDLRVLDTGDELLLDCERVALQELFNMIRRYKLGRDVELHKRTLERGLLSLIGPDARARSRARRSCPRPSTRTAPAQVGGADGAADRDRPRRRRALRRGRHRARSPPR